MAARTGITGSRDATREAFSNGLVEDGEVWMEMIKSRNQSSHTYNEDLAGEWQPETFIRVVTGVTQVTHNSLKTLKRQHYYLTLVHIYRETRDS
ncbi:hypothetical protein G3O08_18880 [Cryomorpha ignava]|uniref:Nucleotidyltransferase n=1 Tax=Cryomorpha ignava TaxID=101383 RepID=A0A7K3WXI6_9FLAO|nr:nucleotidyltransferase substrate binding protein [Cryomorpha ignava]NEN25562.1 hypothetical protein [Cryomorpha ignava]